MLLNFICKANNLTELYNYLFVNILSFFHFNNIPDFAAYVNFCESSYSLILISKSHNPNDAGHIGNTNKIVTVSHKNKFNTPHLMKMHHKRILVLIDPYRISIVIYFLLIHDFYSTYCNTCFKCT